MQNLAIENPYRGQKIEFHIAQSFPATCLNRDDVGAPKTAIVGGVTRARVSSQCWKRQVRMTMQEFGAELGIRTKKVAEFIADICVSKGADKDLALECSSAIAELIVKDTLHFFSKTEAIAFADYAKEIEYSKDKVDKKVVLKLGKESLTPAADGIDIALFGRMVAQAPEMNMSGAATFSHAISTHKVSNEVEFFTALDDYADEQGSAHMGSLEFNSATYYRYIALDLGQLYENLGGDKVNDAVEVFTKALFLAVPEARQRTQSGASPWEFAKIFVRKGQGLQIPFESPIKGSGSGFLAPSIEFIKSYMAKKESLYGTLFGKVAEYTYGEDEGYSIDHLVTDLTGHVDGSSHAQ